MKKTLIGFLLVTTLIRGFFLRTSSITRTENSNTAENSVEFYKQLAKDLDIVKIIDTSELTFDMLQNRDGKIIIEECIGIVTSHDGDGKILNIDDDIYNYISYRCVEDSQVGDVILTYFIYEPNNNFEDDILLRFDYIIDRTEEHS
jgi:hypothetical protein